jgi:hypothetical protein
VHAQNYNYFLGSQMAIVLGKKSALVNRVNAGTECTRSLMEVGGIMLHGNNNVLHHLTHDFERAFEVEAFWRAPG